MMIRVTVEIDINEDKMNEHGVTLIDLARSLDLDFGDGYTMDDMIRITRTGVVPDGKENVINASDELFIRSASVTECEAVYN